MARPSDETFSCNVAPAKKMVAVASIAIRGGVYLGVFNDGKVETEGHGGSLMLTRADTIRLRNYLTKVLLGAQS